MHQAGLYTRRRIFDDLRCCEVAPYDHLSRRGFDSAGDDVGLRLCRCSGRVHCTPDRFDVIIAKGVAEVSAAERTMPWGYRWRPTQVQRALESARRG